MPKQSSRNVGPSVRSVDAQMGEITDAFVEEVEQALKHFHKPEWLGKHSVLGTPYFLGIYLYERLNSNADDVTPRGRVVQQLLQETTALLPVQNTKWGDEWQRLLNLRFLNPEPQSVWAVMMELGLSEATYLRRKDTAIEQLAQGIISRLKPALRLEAPQAPAALLGRDELIKQGMNLLRQGKMIGLIGPGGIGKTALGAILADRFAPNTTFWFTLRPGLNDDPSTLLFNLAYFLHSRGASTLWLQLVADRVATKPSLAINLLRHDLEQLTATPLVLCFDEVDLLRPAEVNAHGQLISLFQSLRGLAPMVLIGQKLLIETDQQLTLAGLAAPLVAQFLQRLQVQLSSTELDQLQRYTDGNPRLLELFIAWQRSGLRLGHQLAAPWASASHETGLEFLLRRIWQHLNETEMYFLELLAIFRSPAPRLAWSTTIEQAALDQLIEWRLVQVDGQDAVDLLPAFKDVINSSLLPTDEKQKLHWDAASIRTRYGQYTAAAYHWLASDEPQIALWLWQAHREQEIDQGQAAAALALWQSLVPDGLPSKDREALLYLRAELLKLLGQYDQSLKELKNVYWRVPFLQTQAKRLEGDITELRGQASQALEAYRTGVETIEQWIEASASMHRALGFLHFFKRDFEQAQREVFRIRHDAANLEAVILREQKNVSAAQTAYEQAIQLAKDARYPYGEANARNHLGSLLGWQRKLSEAESYLQEAIQFFKLTGRLNKLASATYNLAFARRLSEQYQGALEPAQEALMLFEQLGEEFGRAVTMEILAEIYLGLGDLAEAEQFARRVLQEENTNTQPDGLRTLGEIRLKQGNLPEAEQLIQKSLKLAEDNEDKVLEGYAWRALGEVYLAYEDHQHAEESFSKAIAIFTESGMSAEVEKTHQVGLYSL